MSEDFERYVSEWHSLVTQIETLKELIAPLQRKELPMRKAIVQSIKEANHGLKEGTSTFGNLKIGYALERKVDTGAMQEARERYNRLNDVPCSFDDLFRVKYEINKANFDKLTGEAKAIVSVIITTTEKAPTLEKLP